MREARRHFLRYAGAAFSSTMLPWELGGQNPRNWPTPPAPALQDPQTAGEPGPQVSKSAILREHEKAFRECLTALSKHVGQLQQEVATQHAAEIFSLTIYKQTGEIEKLAKQLKSLAKG